MKLAILGLSLFRVKLMILKSKEVNWGYKVGDEISIKDMHYGTHFEELGPKPRKMIKLQNILPSGIKIWWRVLDVDGEFLYADHFNAVDYNGIGCRCPDFVLFRVIRLPNFLE